MVLRDFKPTLKKHSRATHYDALQANLFLGFIGAPNSPLQIIWLNPWNMLQCSYSFTLLGFLLRSGWVHVGRWGQQCNSLDTRNAAACRVALLICTTQGSSPWLVPMLREWWVLYVALTISWGCFDGCRCLEPSSFCWHAYFINHLHQSPFQAARMHQKMVTVTSRRTDLQSRLRWMYSTVNTVRDLFPA